MEALKILEFRKIDGTPIENVEKYVKNWTIENPYGKVLIGCDSQVHGRRIKYSVIIVMHYIDVMKIGHGCHLLICDIWEKRVAKTQIEEIPSKLWKEAQYALQTAELLDGKDEYFKKKIEIHLDFNSVEKFKSNMMYSSGMGLIQSAGYFVLGKPFAQIASNCADHFCR